MLSPVHLAILGFAAFAAGAINSIAGGGSLISFPALVLMGVPPMVANGTNTVALVPGSLSAFWQYKNQLNDSRQYWLWLGVPSLVGGCIGAVLAVHAGNSLFAKLTPWLVLGATVLVIVQEPIRRLVNKNKGADLTSSHSKRAMTGVMVFQFFVSLYGGFFGAGIGILMLAALLFLGVGNINRVNGLKNFAAVLINGMASLVFAFTRSVNWPLASLMAIGAIAGGYTGAAVAQKLPQGIVRTIIIVVGLVIAGYMFVKQFA